MEKRWKISGKKVEKGRKNGGKKDEKNIKGKKHE